MFWFFLLFFCFFVSFRKHHFLFLYRKIIEQHERNVWLCMRVYVCVEVYLKSENLVSPQVLSDHWMCYHMMKHNRFKEFLLLSLRLHVRFCTTRWLWFIATANCSMHCCTCRVQWSILCVWAVETELQKYFPFLFVSYQLHQRNLFIILFLVSFIRSVCVPAF